VRGEGERKKDRTDWGDEHKNLVKTEIEMDRRCRSSVGLQGNEKSKGVGIEKKRIPGGRRRKRGSELAAGLSPFLYKIRRRILLRMS